MDFQIEFDTNPSIPHGLYLRNPFLDNSQGHHKNGASQCRGMIRPAPPWGWRGWTGHRASSRTVTGSAAVGALCPFPLWLRPPSPGPGSWWGQSWRRSGGSQGRCGGRGRLELLRGGRQVAPGTRGGFPTVYNTSCFSLSLSLFSLSLFPVSPALPSPLLSPIYVLGLPVVPAGFVSPHWWHTGPKRLPIPGITPPGWVGWGTLLQEAAGMD